MLTNDPVTQARLDLAAALRCAARQGLNEGVCNHFSMAVPGREDLFLVNPMGLHWSEVTPDDLVIADFDGNVIEGRYPVENSAFFIHGRIHQGNKRAQVVLHTHMPYATALTSIEGGRIHRDIRMRAMHSLDARGRRDDAEKSNPNSAGALER